MTPASINLYLSNSEAKPISPMPSLSRSPLPTVCESPSRSLPKAVSPPLILSSSSSVAVPKSPSPKPLSGQPPTGIQPPTYEPSLDDALDKLLAMSFSRPENEAPITASAASRLTSEVHPEVYEDTVVAADRSKFILTLIQKAKWGMGSLRISQTAGVILTGLTWNWRWPMKDLMAPWPPWPRQAGWMTLLLHRLALEPQMPRWTFPCCKWLAQWTRSQPLDTYG